MVYTCYPSILQQEIETEVPEGSGTPSLEYAAGTKTETKEVGEREPSPKWIFGSEG